MESKMKKWKLALLGLILLTSLIPQTSAKLVIDFDHERAPVGGTILPFNPIRLIGTILILAMIIAVIVTVGVKGSRSSFSTPKIMRH